MTMDGEKSTDRELTCGVPQGYIFHPILFSAHTVRAGNVV